MPVSDIYVVCVPTPFEEKENEKAADLSYVESAAKEVAQVLKKGDLVILESTVPPHTTAMMTKILADERGLDKSEFYTAHCPERVLPGKILYELKHNDRIIGAEDSKAAEIIRELYETFVVVGHCYVCDDVTAELCKLVENTFRDINIAYANQLSVLCEKAGIYVFRLIELANKHPRVSILTPGLGVGGHCLAVDPNWYWHRGSSSAWIQNSLKMKTKMSVRMTVRSMRQKDCWNGCTGTIQDYRSACRGMRSMQQRRS